MGFVSDLAAEYESIVSPPGIPWAELEAHGHGIEENGYDPAYMDTMLEAFKSFMGVIGTLDIERQFRTMEAAEGRKAITGLYQHLDQVGGAVWTSLKQGDLEAAFDFSRPMLIDAVSTVAAYASNGAYLHFDGAMEDAMRLGLLSPDRVMSHAQHITQIFQTFVALDQDGGFTHIQRGSAPTPQAGLGFAWFAALPAGVAYAVVALGVVVVLGLCYLIYKVFQASPEQDQVAKWCDQLIQRGGSEEAQFCIKAQTDMQNSKLAGLWGSVSTLAIMAGIGIIVYAGAMAFPHIATGLVELKSSKRASS